MSEDPFFDFYKNPHFQKHYDLVELLAEGALTSEDQRARHKEGVLTQWLEDSLTSKSGALDFSEHTSPAATAVRNLDIPECRRAFTRVSEAWASKIETLPENATPRETLEWLAWGWLKDKEDQAQMLMAVKHWAGTFSRVSYLKDYDPMIREWRDVLEEQEKELSRRETLLTEYKLKKEHSRCSTPCVLVQRKTSYTHEIKVFDPYRYGANKLYTVFDVPAHRDIFGSVFSRRDWEECIVSNIHWLAKLDFTRVVVDVWVRFWMLLAMFKFAPVDERWYEVAYACFQGVDALDNQRTHDKQLTTEHVELLNFLRTQAEKSRQARERAQ